MKMELSRSRAWSTLLVLSGFFLTASVHAATVTFDLGTVFSSGAVAPDGSAPYATITLDDSGGTGTVIMTTDVATTVGAADLTQL